MIGYLKGQILEAASEGKVLLAAGESGSVGYQVQVPLSPGYGALSEGKSAELYIYTHVREDALDLYGFLSKLEKDLFLTLLSVNGIGPKGALGILSKVEPARLIRAILDEDKEGLVQIPGIGKKTAERVVLELSGVIQKKVDSGAWGSASLPETRVGAHAPAGATAHPEGVPRSAREMARDAKEALLGLGYRDQDINAILGKILNDERAPSKVEDLIRTALQRLA